MRQKGRKYDVTAETQLISAIDQLRLRLSPSHAQSTVSPIQCPSLWRLRFILAVISPVHVSPLR